MLIDYEDQEFGQSKAGMACPFSVTSGASAGRLEVFGLEINRISTHLRILIDFSSQLRPLLRLLSGTPTYGHWTWPGLPQNMIARVER